MRPKKRPYFVSFKDYNIYFNYIEYGQKHYERFSCLNTALDYYYDKGCYVCYTNDFKELHDYCKKHYDMTDINLSNITKKLIGFRVGSLIVRDMKYHYGTDKYSPEIAVEIIQNKQIRWNSSYTGEIGRSICIDKIKKEFNPVSRSLLKNMINKTSQGAIIYSRKDITFYNVLSNDIKSAYPAILLEQVPYNFKLINPGSFKIGDGIHFGKIIVKGLKAKDLNFLPLYRGKEEINDSKVICSNKRIIAAIEYSYYGFIEHELELLNYAYTYKSIELDLDEVYDVDFKYLPVESLEAIKAMYNEKSNNKGSANYFAIKQKFNRIFGYFLTTIEGKDGLALRDREVPYYIGLWVVSAQRNRMIKAFKKVGIENIVASHTDSIITKNVSCDVFNDLNKEVYKDIGKWDSEPYEAIEYFSNTRAKYLQNGKIGFKHGGISEQDIEGFLKNNQDFAAIKGDSVFNFTLCREFNQTSKGFEAISYQKPTTLKNLIKEEYNIKTVSTQW